MKVAVLKGDIQLTIRDSESELKRWISDRDKRFGSATHGGVAGVTHAGR